MNPIGVGFLDLNPEGLFHLERMQLRTDFRCLAGWNSGPSLTKAHGLLETMANSAKAIIEDPRISLIWVGPQADSALISSALAAGKHVLAGLPIGVSPDDWRSWTDQDDSGSQPKLFVAALHRWDGQFQTVQQLVGKGELGRLIDVRRISRQYVPLELGVMPTGSTATPATSDSLERQDYRVERGKWFEMLDELLLLVQDPIVAVSSDLTGVGLASGVTNRRGRCATIQFESGSTAILELNRRSLVPLETGWVLQGSEAGFIDGKRYRASAEFELIDVPVEEVSTDQSAFYNSLAAAIQNSNGKDFPVTYDSIHRVLRLWDAMQSSIESDERVLARI